MKKNYVQPDCRSIRCLEEAAILAGSPGDKNISKKRSETRDKWRR